ncbi:MAG: sulfatase-like hydrolase/transferase [Rubripirellula sp.]
MKLNKDWLIAIGGLMGWCAMFATAAAAPRPNVVVIYVDDLGWQDIGCYGGQVRTPTLDQLAAGGVRFTDFHSGCAVCSPSRATVMTGRNHIRSGIYHVINDHDHAMHLLESEVTIAEILKQNGYDTVHLGKWHMGLPFGGRGKPTPYDHGFDYWFGTENTAHPSHKDPVNFRRHGKPLGRIEGYACQIVVDEAISWLEKERKNDTPFFLNIWFHEPHSPIAAPDEIVAHYGDLDDPAAIYSGTIENTDRAIARLVEKLTAIDELENTIIVYASDNGSYRPERNGPLKGSKGSNFEGGTRVPGIFYWPDGIPAGQVEKEPAGVVDLLPTICGLAEIDKPAGVHLDGSDLSTLLTGRRNEFQRHIPLFFLLPTSKPTATVRDGRFALVAWRDYELPKDTEAMNELMNQVEVILKRENSPELRDGGRLWSKMFNTSFANKEAEKLRIEFLKLNRFQESWIPTIKAGSYKRFELYDLGADIGQKTDIAKQHPGIVSRLRQQLLEITTSVMSDGPDWNLQTEGKKASSADKTTMETKTRIHRLATTKRSVFDAFSYLNRIPEKPFDEEAPEDLAGRIFSRLANQEGRILLKVPDGMDRPAYEGFKTFLRYEGTTSVGNCSACHALPDFSDGKSHIDTKAGEASLTPSLRNSIRRGIDLKKALRRKLDAVHLKRSGASDRISDEYSTMQLSTEDVSNLIAFLKLLDDVSDERFRELILNASVLDTSPN